MTFDHRYQVLTIAQLGTMPAEVRDHPLQPQIVRVLDQIPGDLRDTIRACCDAQKPWPLFIYGPPGVGKTCAALCLADRVVPCQTPTGISYHGACYHLAADFVERATKASLRRLYSTGGAPIREDDVWRLWRSPRLAIMDEVAQGPTRTAGGQIQQASQNHIARIQRAIDERQNTPTIFISNHTIGEVSEMLGEPVASRLASGTVFHATGEDRRIDHHRQEAKRPEPAPVVPAAQPDTSASGQGSLFR